MTTPLPAACCIALLAKYQGDAEAAEHVATLLPGGPRTEPGTWPFLRALETQRMATILALDAGDLAQAREWLEAHDHWLAWSGAVIYRSEGQILWAKYSWQAGDIAHAYQHARQALVYATEPRQPLALLAAHRLLGELDTDAQRFDTAHQHLDQSLTLADACAAPYERALTLLSLADLHTAIGSHKEATALLDELRAICTPLDAKPALARAAALAAHLDAMSAAPATYPDGLSAREVDVLRLIATGRNNQEIADELSLSVRTVERHITNLYAKIGARGRADATAYALRHRI